MGIEGINNFLKKKGIVFSALVPLKIFSGFRVAIDAYGWIHRYGAIAHKNFVRRMTDPLGEIDTKIITNDLVQMFLNFNMTLMSSNVTPIWVWDGEAFCEKKDCQNKRIETKKKASDKLKGLRDELIKENKLMRDPAIIKLSIV